MTAAKRVRAKPKVRGRHASGDFRGMNLAGHNMHHAIVHHARFHGANLAGANMHHITAHYAAFHGANMTGVIMNGSILHHAGFKRTNLTNAVMHHSNLIAAQMHRATLNGADGSRSNLTGAVLLNASLRGVNMRRAKLRGANLAGADFGPGDRLGGKSARGLTERAAAQCGTSCSGADLTGVDLRGANLKGASFVAADLTGADLKGADLTNADLTGADLAYAKLANAKVDGANFSGANLTNADLTGVNIPSSAATADLCYTATNGTSSKAITSGLVLSAFSAPTNGSGTVSVVGPGGLTLTGTYSCTYASPRTTYNKVTITITGGTGDFQAGVSGLTVNSANFNGTIVYKPADHSGPYGQPESLTWNVHSSSTLTYDTLSISSQFDATSSSDWSLTAFGGSGSLTSPDSHFHATTFDGTITYSSGTYTGALNVSLASNDQPFFTALPDTWTKTATLEINFTKRSTSVSISPTLDLTAISGSNSIKLKGVWTDTGYELDASGSLSLNGSAISVSGTYDSKGYEVNGEPLTAAAWSVTGSINNVALGNGAEVESGSISFVSGTPGFTGSALIQPAASNSFAIATSLAYTDTSNWAFTVSPTQTGSSWSPDGMTNLVIDPSSISGTITDVGGSITWALSVSSLTWTNPVRGGSLTTSMSISNSCPLASPLTCGSESGIFLGFTNGTMTLPDVTGTVSTQGAFLADGSWALLTGAVSGSKTFTGPESTTISMSNPSVWLWKGDTAPSPYAGLTMPNLNGAGFGIQFCSSFNASLPYIGGHGGDGCVSWSSGGIAVGQVGLNTNTGSGTASVDGGSGSVPVSGAQFTGWGWTNSSSHPTMSLTNGISDVVVTLAPHQSQLQGNVVLPGHVSNALGLGTSHTTIPASGMFSDPSFTAEDASFSLTASLPLNVGPSNGFTLKSIDLSVDKSGAVFSFEIRLDASYHGDNGNFPVTVAFTGQDAGLTLSLTAKGYGTSAAPCQTTCDGVNSALVNPQTGYVYLSDSFMDVPGLHLWAASGQLEYVGGLPGFGISGSSYLNPAKMSTVLHGTDWMWSNSVANVNDVTPCMKFGFTSPSNRTYVEIEDGVFKTSTFEIAVAPDGCTVGGQTLPAGATFMVDTSLGGADIDLDMAITKDANGKPVFTANDSVTNLTLGGITFEDVSLSVYLSNATQSVSYTCSFTIPNSGTFDSTLAVTRNGEGHTQLDGEVSLADWGTSTSKFAINSFTFDLSMDTTTGYFYESVSGDMKMGAQTSVVFDGTIEVSNGVLEDLDIYFDYKHGGVATVISLDYDSSTHVLAGSYTWSYTKETSKTILSYKYTRHADIKLTWSFSIDTDDPSQFVLKITGTMSGDDISGSVTATISTKNGVDDSASASISIHKDSTVHWSDSWTW